METLYALIKLTRKKSLFLIAALFSFSITFAQPSYTGFTPAQGPPSPGDPSANIADPTPAQLGVKFRVSVDGVINGIRFYKGTSNTGTHVGNLWTNGNSGTPGTNLATQTFIGETAGGWQEVTFSTPVHITANTVYVASYHTSAGFYAAVSNYFNNGNITNGPITFIDDATDPAGVGNGVYEYGGTGTFPEASFQASNYWVDIRFTPDFLLPVSLTDFTATAGNSDVVLNWKTASEENNKGFAVQRSNNNRDWYDINFVAGAGQSSTNRSYTLTDKSLAPGVYYYRLNQIDFDGKSKASHTVTATITGRAGVALFQNTPNPFSGNTKIRFDLPTAQKVRLSVFDMSGREIRVLVDAKKETGSHLVDISSAGLSRQLYYVRLQTDAGILTRKIVVE